MLEWVVQDLLQTCTPRVVGAVCEDRGVEVWSKTDLSYEWFEKIS